LYDISHKQSGRLTMFVPDRWQSNPYRVLRLSASASASDIHKAAAAMRRLALLGVAETAAADMPRLGPLARTEAGIRAAVGRLGDPAQRLVDRLFWFHLIPDRPESANLGASGHNETHVESAATRRHDDALHGLYASLDAGIDAEGVVVWTRSLRAWCESIADDEYWVASLEIDENGTFEPSLLPSEVDSLREEAAALAAEPLIVAARDAVARDDATAAVRIIKALKELVDTGTWVANALYDIASLSADRLRTLCRVVHDQLASGVVREQNAGERNKRPCDVALRRFRSEIQPALSRVLQLVSADHELAQQSREEAALCLSGIATDYTWANDFITAEELHEEALTLARDTLGAIRIADGLAQIRQCARNQRVYGTPITSAPSLITFNSIGLTLYGHSDFDPATQSYSTTHYFVALFVPLFPIARYRVIKLGRQYRFLGKLPLRKGDRWHIGISAAVILALIVGAAMSSSTQPIAPHEAGRSGTSSTYTTTSPRSQSAMVSLNTQIESGRSQMKAIQEKLQPVIDEVNRLDSQAKALAIELNALDKQRQSGEQVDNSEYNAKVDQHNALLARRRGLVGANRADIQQYDELEKEDSAMVKKYNALIGTP
jgi:hypothetical protein